jgi:hypothetical protein
VPHATAAQKAQDAVTVVYESLLQHLSPYLLRVVLTIYFTLNRVKLNTTQRKIYKEKRLYKRYYIVHRSTSRYTTPLQDRYG